MSLLDGAVEVGADDVAIKVADDEERGIQERFAVAKKLPVGVVEVLLFAFVLPRKAVALPDIGKAALGLRVLFDAADIVKGEQLGVLHDALLETKVFAAGGISLCRRRLAEQTTEVVKMFLISRSFLARIPRPFLLKLGWIHLANSRVQLS